MKKFYKLFIEELKNIYEAEKCIAKIAPKLAAAAHNPQLKEAFKKDSKEAKRQAQRLEKIAALLNESLQGAENEVIHSLMQHAHKIMREKSPPLIKDAALIKAAQLIEHYEIATYGTLKAFAKHLNTTTEVYKLLEESSKEEGESNKNFTSIAEGNLFHKGVNDQACKKCA